jgi:hypothetical protein
VVVDGRSPAGRSGSLGKLPAATARKPFRYRALRRALRGKRNGGPGAFSQCPAWGSRLGLGIRVVRDLRLDSGTRREGGAGTGQEHGGRSRKT